MKETLSNLLAIIWFFAVLLGAILMGAIGVITSIFGIIGTLKSGFPSPAICLIFAFLGGVIFAVTGWVPPFRKCYYKLPWLYPLSVFLVMNLFILGVAETILSEGFSVINETRHMVTIGLAAVQAIVCRLLMCVYIKKNPMVLHKYDPALSEVQGNE